MEIIRNVPIKTKAPNKTQTNKQKAQRYIQHIHLYICMYSLYNCQQKNLSEVLQRISKEKQLIFQFDLIGQNEV